MSHKHAKSPRLLYMIGVAGLFLTAAPVKAINTDDAFPLHQENPNPSLNKHPLLNIPAKELPQHHPNLTEEINEPHPYPEYLNKFPRKGRFPVYYYQLLNVHPDDQVQSKVFDRGAFKKIRRIGVVMFENKTTGIGKDETAGELVANQVSSELQSVKKLSVVPPVSMLEEVQLKMVTSPKDGAQTPEAPVTEKQSGPKAGYDLPYPKEKFDAVLIGTVTRYTDRFRNRAGNPDSTMGAGLEFGVYLISTETGEAIWGARFTGSQTASLGNVFSAKRRWMDKKDFSRYAIKKVLKDFHNMADPK